jgi:aryl-alcohol dehydrogenase-like predicted oxidoreductase
LILELSKLAKANQITPLDVCLAYGQAISWASGIVVGAVNASQVIQIVESRIKLEDSWLTKIDTASLEILDPRRW